MHQFACTNSSTSDNQRSTRVAALPRSRLLLGEIQHAHGLLLVLGRLAVEEPVALHEQHHRG